MENEKEFLIGCNYWASNAGCFTWRNFDAEVIKKDVEFLANYGVNCLRIFPTWDDFQPIRRNLIPSSPFFDKKPFKMRVGEDIMLNQKYKSGLSAEKVEQFKFLIECAQSNGIKIIVSFITGWMSGRQFIPEAFLGKDVITDPECIIWECAFIKDLIAEIKHYDNIIAYEPGNECNCLSHQASEKEWELWMLTICDAIRVADSTRPVYSGAHSAKIQGAWNIPTQGQYFDVLTTHPYPTFTPYCGMEDIRQMRASLHAAAETYFYSAIAEKPCMVEEISTLGPAILSDEFVPEYFDRALATSLAVGTNGFLWWCGFEQDKLNFEPYKSNTLERNLGLAYGNRTPKPVLKAMKEGAVMLKEIGRLPIPKADAVAVLPAHCDHWKVAYGAFMLGIQSGRVIDFCAEEQALKDSDYYILPSVGCCVSMYKLEPIIEKVKAGANLLVTLNGGEIAEFERLTGLKVAGRNGISVNRKFKVNGKETCVTAPCQCKYVVDTAEVLIADENGEVVLSSNKVGKGKVFLLTVPLEDFYTESFMPEDTLLYEVYNLFFANKKKLFSVHSNRCMVTTHELGNGNIGVMLNNYDERDSLDVNFDNNYTIDKILYATLVGGKIFFERKYAYLELKKNHN